MAPFNPARCKVQLRLAIPRLRTVSAKQESLAKAARREVATLIEKGKLETARIRTETIISDDLHVELLELMEILCEVLLARFALMEQPLAEPDPAIAEAVAGIIYAATSTEIKELLVVRELLMSRYGRDYSLRVLSPPTDPSAAGAEPSLVSARILSKLPKAAPPDPMYVDAYLREIALAYGQKLDGEPAPFTFPEFGDAYEDESVPVKSTEQEKADPSSRTAGKAARMPDSAANGPSSDRPTNAPTADPPHPPASSQSDSSFDALAARFAALKKGV